MSTSTVILAGYLMIAMSGIAFALTGRAQGHAEPLRAIMRRPSGRWLVLLLWFWTGWHFFAR
jgi:hypothetical protein